MEQNEKKQKGLVVALVIALILLLGALIGGGILVNQLKIDKQALTEEVAALQTDLNNLTTDYEDLNAELEASRAEVAELSDQIEKTEAVNRAKMRKYEQQLASLRKAVRGYVAQINELNAKNEQLTADLNAANEQIAEEQKTNAALNEQVCDLTHKVTVASVIKADYIDLKCASAKGKLSYKTKNAAKLVIVAGLGDNVLAPKGELCVKAKVMNEALEVVAVAEGAVDYQGEEVEVVLSTEEFENVAAGKYTVAIHTAQGPAGYAELSLR